MKGRRGGCGGGVGVSFRVATSNCSDGACQPWDGDGCLRVCVRLALRPLASSALPAAPAGDPAAPTRLQAHGLLERGPLQRVVAPRERARSGGHRARQHGGIDAFSRRAGLLPRSRRVPAIHLHSRPDGLRDADGGHPHRPARIPGRSCAIVRASDRNAGVDRRRGVGRYSPLGGD